MNASRCLIDKNTMGAKEITKTLACCRGNVVVALQALAPKAIIVAGDIAMRQVLRKSGITKARGTWAWSKEFECWALPVFHPAYICRNPALRTVLLTDMKKVVKFIKNDFQVPVDMDEYDYREVTDIRKIVMPGSYVGIDTEDQGLDWMDESFLTLTYQVSVGEGMAAVVRLYEETTEENADFSIVWPRAPEGKKKKEPTVVFVKRTPEFDKKLDDLQFILEHEKIKKVMMHASFDLHAFTQLFRRERGKTIKVRGLVMDVQAGGNLLDENVFKLPSLDDLRYAFTDMHEAYSTDFERRYDKADMLAVPTEPQVRYGGADADATRRVGLAEREQLLANTRLANYFVKFTMPVIQNVLFEMEDNGVLINREELPKVTAEVEAEVARAQREALKLISKEIRDQHKGGGLRLTRRELVADALFDSHGFGLDPVKKTKGGDAYSVDKEARVYLMDQKLSKKASAFLAHYKQFGEMHTFLTRYLRGFDKHIKSDDRVHTSLSLATTVTGRTSTRRPNMQNNPKRSKAAQMIRKLIVAPDGYSLLGVDQSQSELRWLAHLSNDQGMIRVFAHGEDIHRATALSLAPHWETLSEQEQEKVRRDSKTVNFGIIYGMSPKGFVKRIKIDYNIDVSEEEAKVWFRAFFSRYPMVPEYQRKTIAFAREFGFVESLLGRRRRLSDIKSKDRGKRGEAERQAINDPIQGPSSDTVLLACNEVLKKNPLRDELRAVLFVHDELVFEVRDDCIEKYGRIVKHEMENPPLKRDFGFELKVPLVADIKVGKNLGEMKPLSV